MVVVVLAALGYWLLLPKVSHPHGQARPAASPAPAASTPGSQPSQPGAAPAGTAAPATAGGVDIYSWLPFTQPGLAAAATVTEKFVAGYNT